MRYGPADETTRIVQRKLVFRTVFQGYLRRKSAAKFQVGAPEVALQLLGCGVINDDLLITRYTMRSAGLHKFTSGRLIKHVSA